MLGERKVFGRSKAGRLVGFLGAIFVSFSLAAAKVLPAPVEVTDNTIAKGIVAVARTNQSHDPLILMRLLSINLRNPNKWTDQPQGAFRNAQWHDLHNGAGISAVRLDEYPSYESTAISSTAEIEFDRSRCLRISAIEKAALGKASYGGTIIPIVLDGPPGPNYELGREYAQITIGKTTIKMRADKPGDAGCLQEIRFEQTRAKPAPR